MIILSLRGGGDATSIDIVVCCPSVNQSGLPPSKWTYTFLDSKSTCFFASCNAMLLLSFNLSFHHLLINYFRISTYLCFNSYMAYINQRSLMLYYYLCNAHKCLIIWHWQYMYNDKSCCMSTHAWWWWL